MYNKEYAVEYHKKNKERNNKRSAKHYSDNKDRILSRQRESYRNDPEPHRIKNAQRSEKQPWWYLRRNAQTRAKKQGLAFDLTDSWFSGRWTGKCEITGIQFQKTNDRKGPSPFSHSVDRIMPELGYTQSNCRLILFGINAMKQDGTDADVMLIAKHLVASDMGS